MCLFTTRIQGTNDGLLTKPRYKNSYSAKTELFDIRVTWYNAGTQTTMLYIDKDV